MNLKNRKLLLVTGAVLISGSLLSTANANTADVQAVSQIDLKQYLGTWHEIARKPLYFQNKCDYNVTAKYSLNDNGNVKVDNSCYSSDGKLNQSIGEAYVQNAPANSKLKVSFLPKAIRWLPVGRGDYWVLKIDDNYQTALVGSPNKKYLWVLSRTANPDQATVNEYLNYAKSIGFDLSDLIKTKHK